MTTATTRPDTTLTLLFGPDEQILDTLTHAIMSGGADGNLDRAVQKLPEAARDVAAREITAATADLLDINLIDLLIAGWRQYQDLTSAARRTLAAPGSTELVQLATHRVATVQLSLSVVFDVSAVLARVRAGKLAGVHTGSCDITATLAIDDIDVTSKQAHLELPGEITLKQELRLLPAEDYPPSENKAVPAEGVKA